MPWPKYMNVERFQALLAASPFDVVVASSIRNINYTTGSWIETIKRIPLRLALNVIPKDGEPTFIVCNIEEWQARQESPLEDIRAYVEFQQSPIAMLADVLKEKGLANKVVGVEMEHLVAAYYEELRRDLPDAQLRPADRFFDETRVIKTPAEIEQIRRAAVATEQAIFDAFAATHVGDREKDLANRMITNLLNLGADSIRFCVLGSGLNSLSSHHLASDKRLEDGELLRLDFGGYFGAYASDVARNAAVGHASREIQDTYRRYRDIQRATIAQLKPGVRACDIYNYCKRAYEQAGMPFLFPHVGHSIGVDGGHEEPLLQPLNDRALEPNMVFYVEPMHLDPEVGAYHVEDLVRITEGDPEILTTYRDTTDIPVIR